MCYYITYGDRYQFLLYFYVSKDLLGCFPWILLYDFYVGHIQWIESNCTFFVAHKILISSSTNDDFNNRINIFYSLNGKVIIAMYEISPVKHVSTFHSVYEKKNHQEIHNPFSFIHYLHLRKVFSNYWLKPRKNFYNIKFNQSTQCLLVKRKTKSFNQSVSWADE